MKRSVTLVAMLLTAWSFAPAQTNTKPPADTAGSDRQALTQIEQQWAVALTHADVPALNRIIAEDYVSLTPGHGDHTKAELISAVQSRNMMFTSITNGAVKVRVFGSTAVVTGSDVEKSSVAGKDTSGHYLWTDVFANRQGAWMAVASESTFVHK